MYNSTTLENRIFPGCSAICWELHPRICWAIEDVVAWDHQSTGLGNGFARKISGPRKMGALTIGILWDSMGFYGILWVKILSGPGWRNHLVFRTVGRYLPMLGRVISSESSMVPQWQNSRLGFVDPASMVPEQTTTWNMNKIDVVSEITKTGHGGFHKWGSPKIDGFIRQNPITMDDLGVPLF